MALHLGSRRAKSPKLRRRLHLLRKHGESMARIIE